MHGRAKGSMLYYCFIFFTVMLFTSPLWSILQTPTYTYVVSSKDDRVLAINRITGEETFIEVGIYPTSMVIHGGKGYVVNWVSSTLSVLDLTSHTLLKTIPMERDPKSIVIYGGKGYVVDHGYGYVAVVDLEKDMVIKMIVVGKHPTSMVIYGTLGYVTNFGSNSVSVIDLTLNDVFKECSVGIYPTSMSIYGDKGYVVCFGSTTINVIDLNTQMPLKTIPCQMRANCMVIYQAKGYVVSSLLKELSVFDLKTDELIKKIPIDIESDSIVVHGTTAYVHSCRTHRVTVIDLISDFVVSHIKNQFDDSLGFSDIHLYIGLKKGALLSDFIRLFDSPYTGIDFSFVDEAAGEQAMIEFEEEMKKGNREKARWLLETAFTAANPKAYAVAAYAFLNEKWGAKDQKNGFWFCAFAQEMDWDYFHHFQENEGYSTCKE